MKYLLLSLITLSTANLFAQWNTNGTHIYNSNTGNVGIGTSSPRGKFDVDGPGDIYLSDDVNTGTGQSIFLPGHIYMSPYGGSDITYFQARRYDNSGSTSLRIRTYNSGVVTEAMHIAGNGNIGVGTTAPIGKLDINGYGGALLNSTNKLIDADYQDMLSIRSATKGSVLNLISSRTDAGPMGGLVFTAAGAWSDSHLNIAGIVGSRVSSNTSIGGGSLSFWTKNDNGDIPREQMRLNHLGRLGLGTTTPAAKLDVYSSDVAGDIAGNYSLITRISGGGGSGGNLFMNNTWLVRDAAGNNWLTTRIHDGLSVDGSFLTPGVDTKTWWERDASDNIQSWGNANQTYMTLKNGSLGIGTTTPDAKLTVKGVIHTMELNIDVNGALVPDYVFEKNYDLISLTDLENYINQNKHLPEVPSAKEMEENGLNLKEMNLILLKKVEELTLHLINLDKTVVDQQLLLEAQQNEINQLKRK